MKVQNDTFKAAVEIAGKSFEMELDVSDHGLFMDGKYQIRATDIATGIPVWAWVNLSTGTVGKWTVPAMGTSVPEIYR